MGRCNLALLLHIGRVGDRLSRQLRRHVHVGSRGAGSAVATLGIYGGNWFNPPVQGAEPISLCVESHVSVNLARLVACACYLLRFACPFLSINVKAERGATYHYIQQLLQE